MPATTRGGLEVATPLLSARMSRALAGAARFRLHLGMEYCEFARCKSGATSHKSSAWASRPTLLKGGGGVIQAVVALEEEEEEEEEEEDVEEEDEEDEEEDRERTEKGFHRVWWTP